MAQFINAMLMNPFIVVLIASIVFGLISSIWVKTSLSKYNKVPSSFNTTGNDAAQRMLAFYGVQNVPVVQGEEGADFYDPRSRSISLSPSVFNGMNVTSFAVICHEVGHACQHAEGYGMMKFRTALVPFANLGSNAWIILLAVGVAFQLSGLVALAIGLYAIVLLFSLVTLPVEFNASRRAIKYMDTIGLPDDEIRGAKRVLIACAFTYVVAALISALQLLAIIASRR